MSFSSIKISALPAGGPSQAGDLLPAVRAGVTTGITMDSAAYAKAPVLLATVVALPANTYANGTAGVGATLTANANGAFPAVDGITLSIIGARILVKNEVAGANNGIYTLTQVGSAETPWILTRAADCNQSADINFGTWVIASAGTSNTGIVFISIGASAPTMGTTAILFSGSVGTINANLLNTATGIFSQGNIALGVAGNHMQIKGGVPNAAFGQETLVAGSATVTTTAVPSSGERIFLSRASIGATGGAALGILSTANVVPGVSFEIHSLQPSDALLLAGTDVSVINWEIKEQI